MAFSAIGLLLLTPILIAPFRELFGAKSNLPPSLDDPDFPKQSPSRRNALKIAEIAFLVISPIAGFFFISVLRRDAPLNPEFAPAVAVLVIPGLIAYFFSKRYNLAPINSVGVISYYAQIIAIPVLLVLAVHFLTPTSLFALGFAPYMAFPLLAPVPAAALLVNEIKRINKYTQPILAEDELVEYPPPSEKPGIWAQACIWNHSLKNYATLLIASISICQITGIFLGNSMAVIHAFTESRNFLFSNIHNLF